jgi:chemotaxis protein CheD
MSEPHAASDCFLLPGDLVVSRLPITVRTILGSCVAVCLWDPQAGVAAVNHFLLPHPPQGARASERFGTMAMQAIIDGVLQHGAQTQHLRAAVVGGGRPVETAVPGDIGAANRELALAVLEAHRIRVAYDHTGGAYGRKLTFHTGTGRVVVEKVRGLTRAGHGGG